MSAVIGSYKRNISRRSTFIVNGGHILREEQMSEYAETCRNNLTKEMFRVLRAHPYNAESISNTNTG